MIAESAGMAQHCFWFTTLVSKASSLPAIHGELKKVRALDARTINMSQGQKQNRIVAWTFFDDSRIRSWRKQQEKGSHGQP